MKARILALDSDEHLALQALLPWYVSGTLDRAEAARVGEHLAQCPRCQADAAWQSKLQALQPAVDEASGADVDRQWSALRARLDAQPAQHDNAAPPRARPGAWRWPVRWPARWVVRWAVRPLGLVVGLQAAVMLALAVFVGWSVLLPQHESYRALGAAPAPLTANALVVFRPEATEAQIRQALRAGDARLVGGPTVTDAYLLQIATKVPDAIARLRAQPAVLRVESLESAEAGASR